MGTKALILAGGMGTRLRPLTFTIPKPLLPVGERSILELAVERLRDCGIREIHLSVGYRAELIRAFCGDGSRCGVRFHYLEEDEPLGTAGPLRLLKGQVDPGDRILMMNGDVVTDLDFTLLDAFHRDGGNPLTICFKEFTDTSPFGVLEIEGNQIHGIVEKPSRTYHVSVGIYALDAALLDEIPEGFFTIPDLAQQLLAAGRGVGAFPVRGYWLGVERFPNLDEALAAIQGNETLRTAGGGS